MVVSWWIVAFCPVLQCTQAPCLYLDINSRKFITSLAKEVMLLVALVSLSVCLSVCLFVCLWTTLLKKL